MVNQLNFSVDQVAIRMFAQEPTPVATRGHAAIVLLHGAGGNLDFWTSRFGPLLQEANIAFYAPHYFDRTSTGRADLANLNDGVHVPQWLSTVNEAVRFVAARPGVAPDRILLAGISLGSFLALALAADLSRSSDRTERQRLRALIDVSGGLVEPYTTRATSDFPPTLILHGADDTLVPVTHARELDRRLTQLDVAHRTEILAGEGHWFTAAAVPRLLQAISGFLSQHLNVSATAERPL